MPVVRICRRDLESHSVKDKIPQTPPSVAELSGDCAFEKLDSVGGIYQIRLRLFIPTIDRAYAGEQPPREGLVFIPFSG